MLVDLLDLMQRTGPSSTSSWTRLSAIARFLEEQTGQRHGVDLNAWREWIWSRPYDPHPEYGAFKGRLYARIDPRFRDFFQAPVRTAIRLDEVQWGGVRVNGIPPLTYPAHVEAAEAGYLGDLDIVFGVSVDGASRAYPKRILAWHELARDRLGDRELTMVYCTLCGTLIPYESRAGGKLRIFGTSGLLYQSNKLMFDAETHSLWSSLDGTPVIGPLVGSKLRLSMLPVVTTSWGEWRRAHPDTTVLSLETGFRRDYSEGAAYRRYFATDQLMFEVSKKDRRLPNKAEVLVLRLPDASRQEARPVAISADLLRRRAVYQLDAGGVQLAIITSPAGANRVYESDSSLRFVSIDTQGRVLDASGRAWLADEDALRATFDRTLTWRRVPAHRAFWFGWYAQHPDTQLVQ